MELKEARYILAIARHQSIGKAAESLYISQPSLSKYLKNLEERLGAPLFSRHENRYYPTYMGERYLHYAEQIVACGDEWMQEYDDIAHRQRGRQGFDAAVADMEVGEVKEIHLMPEEAYGQVNPDAIFDVEIADLPGSEELQVGQHIYLQNQNGQHFPVTVTAKTETTITFDANHEMAGKELNFKIELVEVK